MPNPKLSLTALTALLGLIALALPRTELDPERVKRRQIAERQLAVINETIQLNRMQIAGGSWDVNTAFNLLQVEWNRCFLLKEITGATPQLLREYEQVFHLACRLFIKKGVWAYRQSDMCQTESQLWFFARELTALRAELGLPPGEEGTTLNRLLVAAEAARRPAPDDGTARLSLPTLSAHE